MRPGLRIPPGSKAAFTARVMRASGAGSGGITATEARIGSGARISVQTPPCARAAWMTAVCAASVAGPAIYRHALGSCSTLVRASSSEGSETMDEGEEIKKGMEVLSLQRRE